jgi:hypothetical protein
VTRSWRKIAANAVAITTPVSRTAATAGAEACRSASRTRRYAAADSTPTATVVGDAAPRTRLAPTNGG